jgi:murein DD-endopeptidase MepM/ murein hydrolase activator NlpD
MHQKYRLVIFSSLLVCLLIAERASAHEKGAWKEGYDITKTGLTPRYPIDMRCSPLTSLYASWDDVDGTRRDEAHSGVDGGRLGDAILSPAPGQVAAVWQANWGWGEEQAILIKHTAKELNLKGKKNLVYYSEFDHLNLNEPIALSPSDQVARGQRLASVYRPGGNKEYLPEVHWEVWEADSASHLIWRKNKFGGRYWVIPSARLVDPLYMLSLNGVVREDLNVDIVPYQHNVDYSNFVGFTYILPCRSAPLSRAASTDKPR